ncbi:MAG: four helix bundle protein [Candidatus Fischerbacteria bacterium RBG_13_37_8]|uniref:Four helix bundle protein n=1 Tax=Candidatus Fischerbacteria bacterium RBG_13_37_8 TaxID=1817863 RepID=A0A1F5VS80_9BACT|nr:MAG: four helix bundle protein [Candidatus Fischerbacteria bacterium RBG_13_37_8]
MIKSYRELLIWQKGIILVKEIYKLTKKFPKTEKFVMSAQMQRAAISIPSNIAEGHARQYSKEFRHFLYIALGSLAELDTLLIVATELGYIFKEDLFEMRTKIEELRKMIYGIVKKLSASN